MEPRARIGKNRGQQSFSDGELQQLLFAHGDSINSGRSLENTKRVLDELLTGFITELCFETARSATQSGRQKIKLDDVKHACRKNPMYLGKIEEVFGKKSEIDSAKKLLDVNDDKITKGALGAMVDGGDNASAGKGKANKKEEEELGDGDDDVDMDGDVRTVRGKSTGTAEIIGPGKMKASRWLYLPATRYENEEQKLSLLARLKRLPKKQRIDGVILCTSSVVEEPKVTSNKNFNLLSKTVAGLLPAAREDHEPLKEAKFISSPESKQVLMKKPLVHFEDMPEVFGEAAECPFYKFGTRS